MFFFHVWNHLEPKKNPVGHGSELKQQEKGETEQAEKPRVRTRCTRNKEEGRKVMEEKKRD